MTLLNMPYVEIDFDRILYTFVCMYIYIYIYIYNYRSQAIEAIAQVQAPEKTPQSPVVKSSSKQLDRAYKIVSGGKECGEFIISPATLKASERFGGPMTLFKRFGAEAGGCDSLGYTVLDRDEVKRWPIIGKVDVKIYRRP